jgi:molecular chaperone GrpE (heat shock protein)
MDEIDVSPTKLLADIEQLKTELADARRQADEYLALLQRERAEFNNFRRRTAEERERDLGLAGEDLIRRCSPSPTTSTARSTRAPPSWRSTPGSRA